MAEDKPQSDQPEAPAGPAEAPAGEPANPGSPGDTTQATGKNPVDLAKKKMDEVAKEAEKPAQAAATSGPDGMSAADVKRLQEDADAAQRAFDLQKAPDADFAKRLLDRQARRDGEEAMDALRDTTEKLVLDSAAGEEAHRMAQARAAAWVAPTPINGKTDEVSIILHPEDPAQRKATIHIRVLGEVNDGFVTVYRDDADKNEVKEGRVAESPRFGTKNRIVAKEVDPKTQLAKGEITHPGYFDWPPLRLNPGDYTAVVTTTAGKELAKKGFTITGESAEDLSEKNEAGPTVSQRAVIQSTQAARASERQDALKNGTKLPDPLTEEDVLGDLVGASAGKKKK